MRVSTARGWGKIRDGRRGGSKLEGSSFHFEVVVIGKERQAWAVFIIEMFAVKSLLLAQLSVHTWAIAWHF